MYDAFCSRSQTGLYCMSQVILRKTCDSRGIVRGDTNQGEEHRRRLTLAPVGALGVAVPMPTCAYSFVKRIQKEMAATKMILFIKKIFKCNFIKLKWFNFLDRKQSGTELVRLNLLKALEGADLLIVIYNY